MTEDNRPPCPICREVHPHGRGLSWDGFGINSCNAYRSRLATFAKGQVSDSLGKTFAAAPELLKACQKDVKAIEQLCDMVNDYAVRLGLGPKVNAEDWTDRAKAAINKATE